MSAEEVKDCTYQESDGICHARGAIAFRLWRATFHLVEITSGHNFGEGQGSKATIQGGSTLKHLLRCVRTLTHVPPGRVVGRGGRAAVGKPAPNNRE